MTGDPLPAETAAQLRRALGSASDRLAVHEYRCLLGDLERLAATLGSAAPATPLQRFAEHGIDLPAADDAELGGLGLAPLEVPAGLIARPDLDPGLPVIGIEIPGRPPGTWCPALTELLGEHHRAPFARLVFLCRSLDPVPLLGRYGFAYHHMGGDDAADFSLLHARFGMWQARALVDGRILWTAP